MGFTLRHFYCCGKLKSITFSLAQNIEKKCSKGEGPGCCDNRYQFFKVKDKHISTDNISFSFNSFTDLHLNDLSFAIPTFAVQEIVPSYSVHSPPLHAEVPLYIYNCVFRI